MNAAAVEPRVFRPGVFVAMLFASAVVSAQQPPPQAPPVGVRVQTTQAPVGSGDRVLSASVWASWITHRDDAGAHVLDLLVLWRGTPGWWQEASSGRGTGLALGVPRPAATNTPDIKRLNIRRGGLDLALVYNVVTRATTIQTRDVPLADGNVICVDGVDAAGGPKIERTLKVDPAMPASTRIDAVIQRSPDVIAYLKCDLKLADAKTQGMLDNVCAQVAGR